jgi:hypothetical protein
VSKSRFLIHPRLQPEVQALQKVENRFNGFSDETRIYRYFHAIPKTVQTVSEIYARTDPQAEAWGE